MSKEEIGLPFSTGTKEVGLVVAETDVRNRLPTFITDGQSRGLEKLDLDLLLLMFWCTVHRTFQNIGMFD